MFNLTPAQLRCLQAVHRSGRTPSNSARRTWKALLANKLIAWTPVGSTTPIEITAAGKAALDRAEAQQACRDLAARCASILS